MHLTSKRIYTLDGMHSVNRDLMKLFVASNRQSRRVCHLTDYIDIWELTYKTEPNDWIPYYLLGRALIAKGHPHEALNALQLCVHRNGMIPDVWITIGELYFQIHQYRDSLEAIARSVRLNANTWESWYNLGVLVSIFSESSYSTNILHKYDHCNNQQLDVLEALKRALSLNPTILSARVRKEELEAGVDKKMLSNMVGCTLLQISDPVPTYVEDTEVQINPLNLVDKDNEWITESEEEDDILWHDMGSSAKDQGATRN